MEYGNKVDEKIEIITKFLKKYPWIQIVPVLSEYELKRDYGYEKNFEELKKEYYQVVKHYSYLRDRKSQGKLTKEQIQKCINANIGGVFGYTDELKEMAKIYDIKFIDSLTYMFHKFGSFENFLKQFKEGKLTQDECILANKFIKPLYDVNLNEKSSFYEEAILKLFEYYASAKSDVIEYIRERGLCIYSSKGFDEALKTLKENEQQVIRLRYGLDDGKQKTFNEISKIFNLSRERIRQIEQRGFRRLRHPSRQNKFLCYLDKIIEYYNIDQETKDKLLKSDETCRLSRKIDEKTLKATNEINNFINIEVVKLQKIKQEEETKKHLEEEKNKPTIEITIDELPISKRLYNCLKRTNNNTIGNIISHNYDYLSKIRNMGITTLNELIKILEKYDYVLDTNGNFVLKDELNKQENTTDNEQELTLEQIKKQNEEMNKRINEKEEKSKLLDEYINLMKEQEKLKEMESSLDEQIKKKEDQLKAKGYKYENN